MATWPTTLPQYVLEGGFNEQIKDQTVETQMEAGPDKIRRRFTQPLRRINCQMNLTLAQRADFEYFYNTSVRGGSDSFTWVHPVTQVGATMRFRNPAPQYTAIGGTNVRVSFVLEVL